MENILIVLGILLLGSAIGGTQLPKLPGAILSLGTLFLAFFNSHARDNMASTYFIIPAILIIVGVMTYLSEKKLATEGDSASNSTKLLASSNFQVIFIVILTFYFLSTFFWPFWS
ncbi:MAG: hypothetical protein ACPGTP_05585 [Bacteroidia bacterium]